MAKQNIFSKNKYIYRILILISIIVVLGLILYIYSNFPGFNNILYKPVIQEGVDASTKPKCIKITDKCPTNWSLSSSKNLCVPTKNWDTNSKPNTEKYKNCLTADRRIIETGCDEGHCRLPIPDDMVIPDGWIRNASNTGIIKNPCK